MDEGAGEREQLLPVPLTLNMAMKKAGGRELAYIGREQTCLSPWRLLS